LVNYAKKGTQHEDKILLIEVINLDDEGIKDENVTKMTRQQFKEFFRKVNSECLTAS